MMNLIYIFILLVILKFILNLYYFLNTKHLYTLYKKYVAQKITPNIFFEKTNNIISLFKKANISDVAIPHVENVGYGQIYTTTVSIMENMHVPRNDIYPVISKMFASAIGVYKSRMFESINPFFWIESLIYLPKSISIYLGIDPDKTFVKGLQIFWWFLSFLGTIIYSIYKIDIDLFIKSILPSHLFIP